MAALRLSLGVLLLAAVSALGKPFPFETVELTQADARRFPAIGFGNRETTPHRASTTRHCRAWPGNHDWPSDLEWKQLNSSLGGALLRPFPAASACYQGDYYNETTCRWLLDQSRRTHFWIEEPLSTLTQWPQGSTCPLVLDAQGTCTRGGFPEYVVNATTVKHIQAAVNFARNKNVRLVIKNTGHDFGGRSMGAGSLSIWVHNLKDFEFIPEYTIGPYSGMAVRVGAGVESWEHFNHMAAYNISVVSPGGGTVGSVGGWVSVAGHGSLTSKYGLGADQVLSINIVTPDGKFLTVDPHKNKDLWWALRGGGPSTFGVITSVVLKAYPPISMTSASLAFAVNPSLNNTTPPTDPNALADLTSFWDGVSLAYRYCTHVIAAGGYCFSYIYPQGNSSFRFTSSQLIPNITAPAYRALLQPLYTELSARHNIPVALPTTITSSLYAGNGQRTGAGDFPVNTRYRSRLFPAHIWRNDTAWDAVFAAIRAGVEEGGYDFHGIGYSPTTEIAGWPGADSAVNPAWRKTALHAIFMEVVPVGLSAAQARAADARVQAYVARWQALMPGVGAYMNEGDPAEPEWQARFYGEKYARLLEVKRRWDPWGVFWASTTVGSEEWEVVTEDGYPMGQNGRLCRVGKRV
ncbi:hypothetical protein CHGG_10003 [Chaetomium globosum CBS 148.51]|uniref:FAD-binding PCMH-type domain-containing protein n=1 Tax=Chaetomium globosum (strain ATCC 6205 / CBS 148.51 / DSM 1962 / NBRC 6347 / NRRL 1970) TaxID=306901 RepID=Q2GPV1_CHAGB|nr:uncharacterized protein CHGG_10003 [Chaetomium globosum CBS 148.51]EAQ83599.1 hypothetical protein CHGG_10003 [Chaetomium globosum CBS 148.51]